MIIYNFVRISMSLFSMQVETVISNEEERNINESIGLDEYMMEVTIMMELTKNPHKTEV